MKIFITRSKLKYFKFETRLSEIINGVLTLAISQFDPILRIGPNLLSSGLIPQVSYDGTHSPPVAPTTTIIKGVDANKKHKIRPAEGRDIRALVSGAPIEFKRTVIPYINIYYYRLSCVIAYMLLYIDICIIR